MLNDDSIRRHDVDTLKSWIRRKLDNYKVAIKDIHTSNILYRGVLWKDRPAKIKNVSYPPPERAALGRANRAGSPMFYCSPAAPAVFYKIDAQEGDYIAVSEWSVIEPLWMHNLGYHAEALRRLGVRDISPRAALVSPIPNESKENADLRRRLSLAFTKQVRAGQEYKYKQSLAINELLFDNASPLPIKPNGPQSGKAAGTAYPAMGLKGAADNIVLWPEFVDRSLRIKSVRYALVEAVDKTRSAYTLLNIAYADAFYGGDIVWQQDSIPEIQRRSYIALEDGRWVQRDGYGNIYGING